MGPALRIFLAGSKRNETAIRQHAAELRRLGCEVFDQWLDDLTDWTNFEAINPDEMTVERFYAGLPETIAASMARDLEELSRSDAFFLALPCGHDAHAELGIALALGLPVVVLAEGDDVPFRLCGYYLSAFAVATPDELPQAVAALRSHVNAHGVEEVSSPNIPA